jgi:hypothetical protein
MADAGLLAFAGMNERRWQDLNAATKEMYRQQYAAYQAGPVFNPPPPPPYVPPAGNTASTTTGNSAFDPQGQMEADYREDNPFASYSSILGGRGISTSTPQASAFHQWIANEGWSGIENDYKASAAKDPWDAPAMYDWMTGLDAGSGGSANPFGGNDSGSSRHMTPEAFRAQQAANLGQQVGNVSDSSRFMDPEDFRAQQAANLGQTYTGPSTWGKGAATASASNPFGGDGSSNYADLMGMESDGGLVDTLRFRYNTMTPQQRGVNSATGFKPARWAVF